MADSMKKTGAARPSTQNLLIIAIVVGLIAITLSSYAAIFGPMTIYENVTIYRNATGTTVSTPGGCPVRST